ncbi:MAG TPA: LmeA family phospholipid-binding protein [Candidatus Limnocylindria bacterium]|nr:LmeA family phospholipid-binding protein [Candidatus Limnocylindria bacterium]
MTGFLRFVVFAVLLVGLLVLVVVPMVASPLLAQVLRDAGFEADEVSVQINPLDPSLLSGRAERVHIRASNVQIEQANIGDLDLILGGVSLSDRSFETVSGVLRDVSLRAGGLSLLADSVRLDGPSDATAVTGYLGAVEAGQLIADAARRHGLVLDDVELENGRLKLRSGGVKLGAEVAVRGGALVLQPDNGPQVLLLQPAPAEPWRLSEVWIGSDGVNIRGVVDTQRLTNRLTAP